jgi:hypothetical protein
MQRRRAGSKKLSIGSLVVYVVTPSETCTARVGIPEALVVAGIT